MLIDLNFLLYGNYGVYYPGPGVLSSSAFEIAFGIENEGLSL